jgi:hypothetical protein
MTTITSPKQETAIRPFALSHSRRPLGSVNAAMRDLDLDVEHVWALLDEGFLIGFNISFSTMRELRILTTSIEHHLASPVKLQLSWLEIIRLILPRNKHFSQTLSGVEIKRCLNCDQSTVANIIKAGLLVSVKEARPGRSGSPMVTRESFETFLRSRRV